MTVYGIPEYLRVEKIPVVYKGLEIILLVRTMVCPSIITRIYTSIIIYGGEPAIHTRYTGWT